MALEKCKKECKVLEITLNRQRALRKSSTTLVNQLDTQVPYRMARQFRVRTQEKNSGDAVRRLGTIIQSIFCAQAFA